MHLGGLGVDGVVVDPVLVTPGPQILLEPLDVQPDGDRVRPQVVRLEGVLVPEQLTGHLPEAVLGGRGLAGQRRGPSVRVHVLQRQVPEDVAQVVAQSGAELGDRPRRLGAERALEVAVLHQRQRRIDPTPDVVALGVDRTQQLHRVAR